MFSFTVSMIASNFVVFIAALFLPLSRGQFIEMPCPFNEDECNCVGDLKTPFVFAEVDCRSATSDFPSFISSRNYKYKITGTMTITANAEIITALYFTAFDFIESLVLVQQPDNSPINQTWNDKAFDRVDIPNFAITGLAGVIPPPIAVVRMGAKGLQSLTVSRCPVPIRLDNYIFKDFSRLIKLSIESTDITEIAPYAFVGLEQNLQEFSLKGTTLLDYPSAINALTNLVNLTLYDVGLSNLSQNAFVTFSKLERLSLGAMNLSEAIIYEDALGDTTSTLTNLNLDSVNLTSVPQRVIKSKPQLTTISLSGNSIEAISKNDFSQSAFLEKLILDSNPISTIDIEAFSPLKSITDLRLSDTKLTAIDLSIFANVHPGTVNETTMVYLSRNDMLKKVNVSTLNKYPASVAIDLSQTALETIDARVGDLLETTPTLKIDISNNTHLLCSDLDWMAVYALYDQRIIIVGSACADKDGQSLEEYLKSVAPHPPPPSKGVLNNPRSDSMTAMLAILFIFRYTITADSISAFAVVT